MAVAYAASTKQNSSTGALAIGVGIAINDVDVAVTAAIDRRTTYRPTLDGVVRFTPFEEYLMATLIVWSLIPLSLELTPSRLGETAKAVGLVLKSPKLRDRLMERSTLIGGGSPDEALSDLREVFEISLGGALKAHVDEPLLSGVASARREQLLDTMYTRIDRLTDRCSEGTAPPMTEVWREFVAIRGCYSQAVALSEPGERGWPHHVVLRLMRYLGTWLRLTKKQLPFAHAVFRFLEVEGALAGDETGSRLARASAELCLPFVLSGARTVGGGF